MIRRATHYGTWYKDNVPTSVQTRRAHGVVVPHAGYVYSGEQAARALSMICDKETVCILAPLHTACHRACVSSFEKYETPFGILSSDKELAQAVVDAGFEWCDPAVDEREHSAEMMLPILAKQNGAVKVVIVYVCQPDDALIRVLRTKQGTVGFVASTDFSHVGPRYGNPPQDDAMWMKLINEDPGALFSKENSVCGKGALATLRILLGPIVWDERATSPDGSVSYVSGHA